MNKQRRKELEEAVRLLEEAYSTIEIIMEQEQEAFDNMPEGLQESERGEQMQENIDNLDSCLSDLENVKEQVEEVIEV